MAEYNSKHTGADIDAAVDRAKTAVLTVNGAAPDANGNVAIESGGGLNEEAASLLITILRKALYESDQSENISALEAALNATEIPDGPVDISENFDVITGNASYTANTRIFYKAESIRCALNPIAFRVEGGKKYTVSFDNYSQYGFYVSGYSYSGAETNYEVVEGTTKNFDGDYNRVLQSGWQSADYTFTPDGTYQVVSIQLRKGSNLEMTSADADAIKQILHIYVEEVE